MSALLLFSSREGWVIGVIAAIAVLFFPLLIVSAPVMEQVLNRVGDKREAAKRGKFPNPELAAIAAAIAADDMGALSALLSKHPNLEHRDEAGETILAHAVENALHGKGNIVPVRALLDAGADPNHMPLAGDRILLRVLAANTPISNELFKLLLDRRADPDTRDRFGVPMLHHAKGQLLKVKILADSAGDINATSDYHFQRGWTPVMALAMDEAYDEALYLVQRGADIHYRAPDGSTLIHILERRKQIAADSGFSLSGSYRALLNTVTAHARRR
jgi:ankyrin repeat protein